MAVRIWVGLAEIALALALVGASALVGVHWAAILLAAIGFYGLLLFVPVRNGRKTMACMALAGFFAATHIKAAGSFQAADLFLFTAGVLLVLRIDAPREAGPPSKPGILLLAGLLLISLGGFIGGLFQPAHTPFAFTLAYQGSRLGPISPRFADALRFTVFTSGLVLLVRMWKPGRQEVQGVLCAYGAGVIVSVAYGAARGGVLVGRAQGLTGHPVYFGLISAFGALVGLGLAFSAERRVRLFGMLVVVAGAVGILTSGTRSALSVVIVGIIILQLGQRSLRATTTLVACAVLGLFASIAGPGLLGATAIANRLSGGAYSSKSTAARDTLRQETLGLIRHHGITGAGFRYIVPPHNLLLGVVAAAGILGLVGLLLVTAVVFRRFLTTPADNSLPLAVLAAALAIFANFWVLNAGWDRWLWLPVALVMASPSEIGDPQRARIEGPGRGRVPTEAQVL